LNASTKSLNVELAVTARAYRDAPSRRRRTKIVCTIGPATSSELMLGRLARAGMNCARLNFSHGTHEEHLMTIRGVRKVSKELGKEVAILQDLPGPKFRMGNLRNGSFELRKGMRVTLFASDDNDVEDLTSSNEVRIPLRQKDLPRFVAEGSTIFFADGSIKLKVLSTTDTEIRCVSRTAGQIFSGKGINVPTLKADFPTFTEQDRQHALFGLENGVDFIAVSFVRSSKDIESVRKFVKENLGRRGGARPSIVAKIEKREALYDIDGIVRASDAIMVARGDLGVENPIEQVPLIQKEVISKSNAMSIPVITATQMLESMVNNPSPTRAEVTDVANAILDGTDALMLSEETAIGKYAVDCVKVLEKVALVTERKLLAPRTKQVARLIGSPASKDLKDAASEASDLISANIEAKLIVVPTHDGAMAARVSKFRPRALIVALTDSQRTLRRLLLLWGVHPLYLSRAASLGQLLNSSIKSVVEEGLARNGDRIAVVCDGAELLRQKGELLFVTELGA